MRGNLASLGALGALVALVALLVVVPMMSVGSGPGSRNEKDAGATARMKDVDGDFVGVVRLEAKKEARSKSRPR
jgi:hypothetical protein